MGAVDGERLLPWRCFWAMEESMNNRQGMKVRAMCMLDSQIGAWVKAKRKRIKRIMLVNQGKYFRLIKRG